LRDCYMKLAGVKSGMISYDKVNDTILKNNL